MKPSHCCPGGSFGALLLDLPGSRSLASPVCTSHFCPGSTANSPPFPAPEFGVRQVPRSAEAVEAIASENIATPVNKISLFISFLGSPSISNQANAFRRSLSIYRGIYVARVWAVAPTRQFGKSRQSEIATLYAPEASPAHHPPATA